VTEGETVKLTKQQVDTLRGIATMLEDGQENWEAGLAIGRILDGKPVRWSEDGSELIWED
jgi:hypothetical protein